jgi:DNA-binding protein Fis
MLSNRILIYSDDSSIISPLLRVAKKSHFYASPLSNFNELLKNIQKRKYLAVFLDYKNLTHTGEFSQINNISKESFVVLITSSRKYEEALNGFEARIFDVLKTPMESDKIKRVMERLNYVKYIVRNITRNMLEIVDTSGKEHRSDAGTIENMSMEKIVEVKLKKVIEKLNLDNLKGFYNIVIEEVEKPMFKLILENVKWNQIKAARVLGINRNTLRKKLRHYSIKK